MNWKELLCDERIRSYKRTTGQSNDMRTEYEKDYHRIIGSASFRRLQDKTQVFPLDKSDFVRTRLTHSLEVSSFGKSLGQSVCEKICSEHLDDTFCPSYKQDICDILQCAGLLHDIGNPPFGHFGEDAIRTWFESHIPVMTYKGRPLYECLSEQMREDFYHFEGNTQALRVVTRLHFLVDEHGMNLTKALLGTIIKYPVSSLGINKKSGNIKDKKMGYYYADREIFNEIQSALHTNQNRHPLTYLLEAADDIAYKTADIEDAAKKDCISYHELLDELQDRGKKLPDEHEYHRLVEALKHQYERGKEKQYDDPGMYAVQNWVVRVQSVLLGCAADSFVDRYKEIMEGTCRTDLFTGTKCEEFMIALGDIAYHYAFISKPIITLEIAASAIFDFLLNRFVGAVLYYDTDEQDRMTPLDRKILTLISDNYKRIYHTEAEGKDEYEKLYLRLLLATDVVCGMTDGYAKDLYQQLNGIVS
ncbi:MAG: deoxyguanosinetriphosphate triphosphohydrolase [Clostridia bacterium]|nr:deoxyguanosinetriphosphate triphosphohydrolase [Clostridia bacterium]